MSEEMEGVTAEAPSETVADVKVTTEETPAKAEEPSETKQPDEPGNQEEPDYKKLYEEQQEKLKDQDLKIKRQTAANRDTQRRYEEALEKVKTLETSYTEKPLEKPKAEDFDTEEDFLDALADYKLEDKERERELGKAKLEQTEAEKQAKEQSEAFIQDRRADYLAKEAEIIKAKPDYQEKIKTFQDYVGMVPTDDAGWKKASEYLVSESPNAPALVYHLSEHPEKIEALFGKPPAYIERKLREYDKEIQGAAPQIPETNPLPKPPTPAKGASRPVKRAEDMEATELLRSIRK